MNHICIIPARKGSKRLPGKNTIFFKGRPIIEWTIIAALESKIFKKVIVSTDCKKTINIAKNNYVDFHDRKGKNISDISTVVDVCLDVIDKFSINTDYIWCLYPTSPLRDKHDLINMKKILNDENYDSVCAVTNYQHYAHQALYEENGF